MPGQTPDTVTTSYRPSSDLPTIQNRTGSGEATRGMCDGYEKLSRAYHAYRLTHPTAPDLNTLTDSIRTKYGQEYLVKVLNAVTDVAFDGNVDIEGFKGAAQGHALTGEIALRMRATNQEQTLLLVTRDQQGPLFHRMSVYGATKLATGGWELRIADSNRVKDRKSPGQSDADDVTLRVKPGRHRLRNGDYDPDEWHVFVRGIPTGEVFKGKGDMIRAPKNPDADLIKLIHMGRDGVPLPTIEREMVQPYRVGRIRKAQNVVMNRQTKAGGVILQVDLGLADATIDETKLRAMSERIANFLEGEDPDGAVFRLEPRTADLELIPLANVKPGQSLGGFSRVRGFVIRPDGKVFLAGERGGASEQSSLQVDDLVFATRAIYKEGRSPFISLDPDPENFSHSQRVRVGDVDEQIRNSSFIRSMIEADYVMKKVSLGRLKPKLPGFNSWVSLVASQPGRSVMRMWLEPAPSPLAEASIYRNIEGATAVFFESDVLALGEGMLFRQDLPGQAGPKDAIVDRAATELTNAFDNLAEEYPEFKKLQGLFDLAKACQAMRNLQIKSPDLDRLCTLVPGVVEIPKTYPGIGPDVTPNGRVVSGGAVAKPSFKTSAAVWTESLAPMIAAAGVQRGTRIQLPASVTIPQARLAGQTADMLVRQAKRVLRAGDAQAALELLTRVSALQPDQEDLKLLLGSAFFALDRTADGVGALGDLPKRNMVACAARGLAYAEAGNFSSAMGDASSLEIHGVLDDRAYATAALIRTLCCDFDGAQRDLSIARSLAPESPMLEFVGTKLRLYRGLGKENAQRRLASVRALPYSLRQRAFAATADPKEGIALSRGILSDLDSGVVVVSPELAIRERAEIVLTMRLVGAGETEEARQTAEALVLRRPTWGSARLVRALIGFQTGAPIIEVLADLKLAAAATEDPAMEDLRAVSGATNPIVVAACTMSMDASRPNSDRAQIVNWVGKSIPSAERQFLNSLVSFEEANTALILKTRGAQGLISGDRTTATKLGRLVPPGLSSNYPTYLAGLTLLQIAIMQPKLPTTVGMEFRSKALAMLGQKAKDTGDDAEVTMRAATYMICTTSILQSHVNPTVESVSELGRVSERVDQLLSKNPSTVKPSEVRTYVKELLVATNKFWNAAATSLRSEVDAIGSPERYRLELFLTWILQSVLNQQSPQMKGLATRYPSLSTSAEWMALQNLAHKIGKAQIGVLNESQLWTKVLAGIKTRQSAQDFEQAVQSLCKVYPALGPRLASKWFRLQLLVTQLD